ncbi:hypothetical protein BBD39_05585 [Arsenophonus endosymbiont of Bemisia tabaci Asia II 3]|nr:hypothetical protein BBD39_05585 [Arsenophonus endosymbiont of Bemisia tabaci Asia II 3]
MRDIRFPGVYGRQCTDCQGAGASHANNWHSEWCVGDLAPWGDILHLGLPMFCSVLDMNRYLIFLDPYMCFHWQGSPVAISLTSLVWVVLPRESMQSRL